MAISRLAGQDATGTGSTSTTATYPGATTSGNLLIATIWSNQAITSNPSGWIVTNGTINGTSARMALCYKLADGTETTVSFSAAGAVACKINIYEYTGNANPLVLDVNPTENDSGVTGETTFSTSSINTANASDLIFGMIGVSTSFTSPSWTAGLNLRQSSGRHFDGDLITSSTQSGFVGTGQWTSSNQCAAIIAAFEAAGGGTTTSTSSTSSSTSSTSSSTSISSTSSSTSTSASTSTSISSTSSSTSVSSTSSSTSTTTLASANGIKLYCGGDLVWNNIGARDYKEQFYAYAPVTIDIPDSAADVTVYFSTSGKWLDNLKTPVPNYQYRTKSVQRNYETISGMMNDFAHFTGSAQNAFVCPFGSVITLVSINVAP